MNKLPKVISILLIGFLISCIDVYEIEVYEKIEYDPFGNLGFEDGLNHWDGKTYKYSEITIDSNSIEGNHSLKLSSKLSSVADSLLGDTSIASISRHLSVNQGDTININFKAMLNQNFNESVNIIALISFFDFDQKPTSITKYPISIISNNWETIYLEHPISEGIESIVLTIDFKSPNNILKDVYCNLDDFEFTFKSLKNNEPSSFQLTYPEDESQIANENGVVEFNWTEASDEDNDSIKYEFKIWTETNIENYLINSSFESVTRHFLGSYIPQDWDFWPYYFNNVFSYPQPEDTIINQNLIQHGNSSIKITGDYTGQENNTILYQGFTPEYIPEGTRVTFSGYMLNSSKDPISNDNHAYLSIDQFGTGTAPGSNSSLIINHTSESITSSHSQDDWHYFETSSTTESNTRSIQIRINYVQFDDDSGSVYIDNLSISTSNPYLEIYEKIDIDQTNILIERTILIEPYDFSDRNNLIFFWNVTAKDMFSKTVSANGPYKFILN